MKAGGAGRGGEECYSTFRRSFSASVIGRGLRVRLEAAGRTLVCLFTYFISIIRKRALQECLLERQWNYVIGGVHYCGRHLEDCTTLLKEKYPENPHKHLIGPGRSCSIKNLLPQHVQQMNGLLTSSSLSNCSLLKTHLLVSNPPPNQFSLTFSLYINPSYLYLNYFY